MQNISNKFTAAALCVVEVDFFIAIEDSKVRLQVRSFFSRRIRRIINFISIWRAYFAAMKGRIVETHSLPIAESLFLASVKEQKERISSSSHFLGLRMLCHEEGDAWVENAAWSCSRMNIDVRPSHRSEYGEIEDSSGLAEL